MVLIEELWKNLITRVPKLAEVVFNAQDEYINENEI